MGHPQGFEGFQWIVKNLTQGTATSIVAAFDPKLDGECLRPCRTSLHAESDMGRFRQNTTARTCRTARLHPART